MKLGYYHTWTLKQKFQFYKEHTFSMYKNSLLCLELNSLSFLFLRYLFKAVGQFRSQFVWTNFSVKISMKQLLSQKRDRITLCFINKARKHFTWCSFPDEILSQTSISKTRLSKLHKNLISAFLTVIFGMFISTILFDIEPK